MNCTKIIFRNYVFLFFVTFISVGFAQDSVLQRKIGIKLIGHYGMVTPHHRSISYFVEDKIKGIDVALLFHNQGDKMWAKVYNNPLWGVGFYHSNLGNSRVFGNISSIYPFFELPVYKNKICQSSFFLGGSISYISLPLSFPQNIENVAISSHFNLFFSSGINSAFMLNSRFKLHLDLRVLHFSNGNSHRPNLGINLVTFSVGTSYNFGSLKKVANTIKLEEWKDTKRKYYLTAAYGQKRISPGNVSPYKTASLSLNSEKQKSYKYSRGFGMDMFYDQSFKFLQLEEKDSVFRFIDNFSLGVHFHQELIVGNLSIFGQGGVYIFTGFDESIARIYERLGMRCKLNENFYLWVAVKAHMAKADFVEWGLGVKL